MATDMYIKLDGIEGESLDSKHGGEIQLLSFDFGAAQSATAHEGSGSTSGRADVLDLSIVKNTDKSSPLLFFLCCSGTHIPKAVLNVRKAGGSAPLDYLTITLTQVLVSSFKSGAQGSSDRVTETVVLNFATIKVDYTPQKADGSGLPQVSKGWNISTNSELS
ncbi:MAG: Hcp family type VI secretion system effector [Myxococcota bacterium]